MSIRIIVPLNLDAVVHLKGTIFFLSQYWNASKNYYPDILAFTHIDLRKYEASASTFRTCL